MTSLIKIHHQLSHVMELRCDILFAHENCSRSGCFIASKLSFLSNFLYVSMKTLKKTSCPFSSSKKLKRRKSGGTNRFSVEQDLWLLIWTTQPHWETLRTSLLSNHGLHCFKLRRMVEGTRGHYSVVPPMKLKVKIQQVLVTQNCWRTQAIPKLPQRESQAQM